MEIVDEDPSRRKGAKAPGRIQAAVKYKKQETGDQDHVPPNIKRMTQSPSQQVLSGGLENEKIYPVATWRWV